MLVEHWTFGRTSPRRRCTYWHQIHQFLAITDLRSFYQEYFGKTLTDKYSGLNTQMDEIVNKANSEISNLQTRLSSTFRLVRYVAELLSDNTMADLQAEQEQLRKKNQELVDMYRDKCRKFTQITNLYNLLKSRTMRSQMQVAASDTVSRTLNSLSYSNSMPPPNVASNRPVPVLNSPRTPSSRLYTAHHVGEDGVERLHRYQRSGTGSSRGLKTGVAMTMLPPSRPKDNSNNREYL